MATIDNKQMIDKLIANNGCYEGDPQIYQIVEYINAYGNITWGVTWSNEHPAMRRRYEIESQFINDPHVIWKKND